MAGHAPKLHPDENRWWAWLEDLSDWTLAGLLLVMAVAIGGMMYLIDVNVIG